MLRGILGFLSGAVVSGIALGGVSYYYSPPLDRPPEAAELDVPAGSEFDQSREDTEAALPGLQETTQPDTVPQVSVPEPDDLSSLEGADTEPADQPEPVTPEVSLTAPETSDTASGVAIETEEPPLPSPQAMAPEAPAVETDLSISTEPAQPAMPEVEEESGAFSVNPEAGADAVGEEIAALAEPQTEPEPEPVPAAEPEPEPVAEPETGLSDLADSVAVEPAQPEDDRPPLEKFAAPFENPEAKPLMSIILIDDGSSGISHDALADFPYPLSYAIDVDMPGAAAAAQKYREAGLEVLALIDLPAGAGPADVEVAMQTYLGAVPEAVAVMEGTGTGLQADRAATEQLIPILQESGHGAVLFSQGLDTAQKLIAREGVPALTVFRDFDADDQNAKVIRRFLDQAAFKAGQEEHGVIMVGRLRAETVTALLLWGLQDRAASVALAPVSAVLTASQGK